MQIEDRENGGMAPSFWNSHEITWNGRDSATFLGQEITDREVLSSTSETVHQAAGHGTEVVEIVNRTIVVRQVSVGLATNRKIAVPLKILQQLGRPSCCTKKCATTTPISTPKSLRVVPLAKKTQSKKTSLLYF